MRAGKKQQQGAAKKLRDYPDVLTVRDVMEILRIGRAAVYQLIQDRLLPARMIANKYRIPKTGVVSMLCDIRKPAEGICYNISNNNSDALLDEKECEL